MTQTRLTTFLATLLAMSLLFQTACTTPTVNKYVIAVDGIDTLVTVLEVADPSPVIATIGNAAEGCANTVLPLLEAGGSAVTIGQQSISACWAVISPVVPPGTPTTIGNDIVAVSKDVTAFLQSFGITIPPPGSTPPNNPGAAMARSVSAVVKTWTPSASDNTQLLKARAKMAKWKPIPVKQSQLLPECLPSGSAGFWTCVSATLQAYDSAKAWMDRFPIDMIPPSAHSPKSVPQCTKCVDGWMTCTVDGMPMDIACERMPRPGKSTRASVITVPRFDLPLFTLVDPAGDGIAWPPL